MPEKMFRKYRIGGIESDSVPIYDMPQCIAIHSEEVLLARWSNLYNIKEYHYLWKDGKIMWYGKMTSELEQLYDEYYEIFGCEPDGYQEVEYGQSEYQQYMEDIKTAIQKKEELPEISN